jgi:hypothetical protein
MKCYICGEETHGSLGGMNICPSCDCGNGVIYKRGKLQKMQNNVQVSDIYKQGDDNMEMTEKELGQIIDITEDMCNADGWVDECLPFAKKRMELINMIRKRKELPEPTTEEILYILKKRYHDELAIQDYIEMIEYEVESLKDG